MTIVFKSDLKNIARIERENAKHRTKFPEPFVRFRNEKESNNTIQVLMSREAYELIGSPPQVVFDFDYDSLDQLDKFTIIPEWNGDGWTVTAVDGERRVNVTKLHEYFRVDLGQKFNLVAGVVPAIDQYIEVLCDDFVTWPKD